MDENEQIEILKSTLAEQQRFHDELTNSFDDTKIELLFISVLFWRYLLFYTLVQ